MSELLDKKDDPDYVLNPKSNRWVHKDGPIGRHLQNQIDRVEILNGISHRATAEMLKNRDLLKSDLSNEQLADILNKLIDFKIDDVKSMHLTKAKPFPARKSRRSIALKPKRSSKRKFVVKPTPRTVKTDIDTECPTETDIDSECPTETDTDW